MKVAIHTLGTRGDIQPYLALAIGLRTAGHDVLIAAPSQFEAFVGQHGIGFAHLPGEFLTLMDTPEFKQALAGSTGFGAGLHMLKRFRPIARRQLTAEWKAAERFEPELMIYHPKAIGTPHLGEKLGCPTVLASPLPGFTPTSAFASPMVPFKSVGLLNRLTHRLMADGGDTLFRRLIAEWRVSELGLAPKPAQPLRPKATLYAFSPSVIARPPDWPREAVITGYWFFDDSDDWRPDPALAQFLAAGEPPVYVGFGSMPGLSPRSLTEDVVEALGKAGRRGLIATGSGALENIVAPHIHCIAGAPHDRLFPLVSACVHHGGAGTTAAAFRAGKPQVICSFFGDQPFWGRVVAELGAGPAPLSLKTLTMDALSEAIVLATRRDMFRQNSEALAQKLRAEDGVQQAMDALHQLGLLRGARAAA
jgi:sterol 3beta-glucosyltransferase